MSHRQIDVHVQEVPSATESEPMRDRVMHLGRLEDPEVEMPAAGVTDEVERRRHELELGPHAAVLGVDDHLEPPLGADRLLVPRDVCVSDHVIVSGLGPDDAGEAFAATLDEVEPLVLAERVVMVVAPSRRRRGGFRSSSVPGSTLRMTS